MLSHVREVNLEDTEAAMGDDDGYLAVVIANRMPLFDEVNCLPRVYTACLVNLEGQLDRLPLPAPPRNFFDFNDLHVSAEIAEVQRAIRTGAAVTVQSSGRERRLDASDAAAMNEAIRRGEVVLHEGQLIDRAGLTADGPNVIGTIDTLSLLDGDFSDLPTTARTTGHDLTVTEAVGVFGGFDLPIEELVTSEPIFRFPVLTSWRFTCSGKGSFGELMQSLDVGLLGAERPSGYKRPLAECVPPETGEGPGAAPITKLPLEIAETGHIGMPYLTRIGNEENAWYRGPFSPHRLMRRVRARTDEDGPILAHVSDHLRMMTPQGRQDVSLAVAFETGRLLAMSQPSFLAALHRWRERRFGIAVRSVKQQSLFLDGVLDTVIDRGRFDDAVFGGFLASQLEESIFADLARRRVDALGGSGPLVQPGLAVPELQGDLRDNIAIGLGIDAGLVERVAADPDLPEVLAEVHAAPVELDAATELSAGGALAEQLDQTLDEGLFRLAELAVGREALENSSLDRLELFDDLGDFLSDRLERGDRR